MGDSIGYQYSDVIYAPGYYNCYTLVVNLSSVCDITRGATFVASPNDPMATKCVCPPSAPCADNPVVDFSQVCNWCLDRGTGIGASVFWSSITWGGTDRGRAAILQVGDLLGSATVAQVLGCHRDADGRRCVLRLVALAGVPAVHHNTHHPGYV